MKHNWKNGFRRLLMLALLLALLPVLPAQAAQWSDYLESEPEPLTLEYNNSPQCIIKPGVAKEGYVIFYGTSADDRYLPAGSCSPKFAEGPINLYYQVYELNENEQAGEAVFGPKYFGQGQILPAKWQFSQTPQPITLTAKVENGEFIFQDLCTTGTYNTGAFTAEYGVYDLTDAFSWECEYSEDIPQKAYPGTYKVGYRLTYNAYNTTEGWDHCYEGSFQNYGAEGTVQVIITPPPSKLTAAPVGNTGLTYDGNPKDLLTSGGTAENGTMQYSVTAATATEPGEWSTDLPQATNAGDYKVWYKVKGNVISHPTALETSYYIDTTPAAISVSIDKATASITNRPETNRIYVNEVMTTAHLSGGTGSPEGGTFTVPANTSWNEAGQNSVTVTYDAGSNYESATAEVTMQVFRRAVISVLDDISITDKDYGTAFENLGLPSTVSVNATPDKGNSEAKTVSGVAVAWHKESYDSEKLDEQIVTGVLRSHNEVYEKTASGDEIIVNAKVKLKKLQPGTVTAPEGKTEVYDGSPVTYEFVENPPTGVESVSYTYSGTGYTETATAPTDAGTYTVKATFTTAYGYEDLDSVETTLTVSPKTLTVTPNSGQTMTYGETLPELTYTCSGNVESQTPAFTGALGVNSTDAGMQPITLGTLALADNGSFLAKNYSLALDNTVAVSLTINKAVAAISIGENQKLTYNGAPVTAAAEGEEGAQIRYSVTGDGTVFVNWYSDTDGTRGTEISAPVNAGKYWIGVAMSAGNNYRAAQETYALFEVDRATPTAAVEAVTGHVYDGAEKALVQGSTTGGTLEYKLGESGDWSTAVPKAADAGSYSVYWRVAENENYYGLEGGKVDASIAEAKMTVTAAGYTGTYDGEAHTVTVTVQTPAGAAVSYAETEEGPFAAATAPTYKDAGSYEVWYQVTLKNYETVTAKETVSIDPKPVTVTGITAQNKAYDSTDEAVLVCGNAQFDGILEGDELTVTANGTFESVNAAEDLTVAISNYALGGADKDNYKLADSGHQFETQAHILPREITVTLTPNGGTYGGTVTPAVAQLNGLSEHHTPEHTLTYTGTANDGTQVNSTEAPTLAGSYTVTASVADENYKLTGKVSEEFTVAKADHDMSDAAWDYTDAFVYDGLKKTVSVTGLPTGVSVTYQGSSATDAGTYTAAAVLTCEDPDNYNTPSLADLRWEIANSWTPKEYQVSRANAHGWMNQDFLITPEEGYLVSLNNTDEGPWTETLTGAVEGENTVRFYLRNKQTGAISLKAEESYKLDKNTEASKTTGKLYYAESGGLTGLLRSISFGLFFNDQVSVKADVTDLLSGVATVEYYASEVSVAEADFADLAWKTMPESGVEVSFQESRQFIYYARVTDKAGNVSYFSTDGAEYDSVLPSVTGVESGKTYYNTRTVRVTDKNLDSVTLNGKALTVNTGNGMPYAEVTVPASGVGSYTVIAGDKAGNNILVTFRIGDMDDLTDALEGKTEDNVTSADKAALENVSDTLAQQLKDPTLTDDERASMEADKKKADTLLSAIAKAEKAANSTDIQNAKDINENNVTFGDVEELDKAKAALENLLSKENRDNYTPSEQAALQKELDRINAAMEALEEVQAVINAVEKLPESVKPDLDLKTETAIRDAKAAFDALSDHQRSLISDKASSKLEGLYGSLDDYKIVKGNRSRWVRNSGKSLRFIANGPDRKFKELRVDGKAVSERFYTHKDGSTVITLKASYLQYLRHGKHTVQVVYTDGATSGQDYFRIYEETGNPFTGDSANPLVWGGIAAASLTGIAVLTALAVKKKKNKK